MQSGNQEDSATARPTLEGEDRLFATAHLHSDLRGRSVRGGVLTVASQAGRFALNTVSLVALARLLTPADFGLVAMVQPITGFVAAFKDLGLNFATVQKPQINEAQVSTLFWINLLVSVLLAVLGTLLAPLVGLFYGDERAGWITVALSATFIFSGLGAQHQAILQRQMRFGSVAFADLAGILAGIVAAMLAAWQGMGYWSLVIMTAVTGAVNVAILWWQSRWIPGAPRKLREVREMLGFGGGLTGYFIVNYLTRNADNVLVGRFLGSEALGYYSRAYLLILLPMRQISSPVLPVAIAALSRLRADPERFRRYYLRILQIMACAGMPLIVFTLVCSESLIYLILGEQWLACVSIFRALGPAAFLLTFNEAEALIYVPTGETMRWFRWSLAVAPVYILVFAFGLQWGPVGVAICYSAAMVVLRFPSLAFAFRGSPLRLSHLLGVLWPPATASIGAGLPVLFINSISRVSGLHQVGVLMACLLIYASTYLGILVSLPGGKRVIQDVRAIIGELRTGRSAE
ncbi:MAG: lipopolysaccharide biosynthesis protein [Armatimonadota bacterium]|nr:MAG: lipopolysaccharide biosynthesis protein [Armatimonadota bacterium]